MDISQCRVWNGSHCDEIITKLLLLEKVPFYNKEEWPSTGAYVSPTPSPRGNLQSVFDAVSNTSVSSVPSRPRKPIRSKKPNQPTTKWRENVVGWFYKIVDLSDQYYFSRETVDIALSYLDAYLLQKGDELFDDTFTSSSTSASASAAMTETETEQVKNLKFKIISSTCIFLAIKLHESNNRFTIAALMSLNGSSFTKADILETEKDIVMTLDFRLSPPTIMSFVRPFLSLFDNIVIYDSSVASLTPKAISHVLGLARFLSELSMYEIYFVNRKTSHIALACVLTAFEGISRTEFPQEYRQKLVDKVYQLGRIDCTSKEVYACRVKLRQMFEDKRPPGRRPRSRPQPRSSESAVQESVPVQAIPVPAPAPVAPSEEERSSSQEATSTSTSQQVNTHVIESAAASIRISRPETAARNRSQQGVATGSNTFPIGFRTSSNNNNTAMESEEQALSSEGAATSNSTSSRTNARTRPLPDQSSSCTQASRRTKRHCSSE